MSLINIQNLTFSYDGSYDNIFENVSFQLDTDWKLGFTGRNGRGKTTFLNLLLGSYSYSGKISSSVSFEYFPYKVEDKTAVTIDIVEQIYPDYQYWQIAKELNLLEVSEEVLYRPFNTLSNGEQTKVLLAVLFLKENSFLLIDEHKTEGNCIYYQQVNQKILHNDILSGGIFCEKMVDFIVLFFSADGLRRQGNV